MTRVYEAETKDVADPQAFTPVKEAPSTDSLALARDESVSVLSAMNRLMSAMIVPDLSDEALRLLMAPELLPPAYQNLLRVVAADSARRRGWIATAEELMNDCNNPALKQAWKGWIARCGSEQQKTPKAV